MTTQNLDFKVKNGLQVAGDTVLSGTNNQVGTVTSGTWSGSIISPAHGGTGQDLSASTGYVVFNAGTTSVATTIPGSAITGSATGLTNIPNSSLTNSSTTIGSTNIALGDTATTLAGLTSLTSTSITGTLTTAAQTSITSLGTLTGLTMNGNIVVNTGSHITLTDAPTSGTDAVNKTYVDNNLAGLTWKNSVKSATTANITLSGEQTIDGNAVVTGDRVLVKDQTTQSENGVYVASTGSWTRSADMDSSTPLNEFNSAAVFVQVGAANADTGWTQTNNVSTIGTDAVAFTQFNGTAGVTAGTGLSKSGNQLDINLGAGIAQLPTDEVGIDVYPTGGLFTTVDGTATSTATAAQLSLTKVGTASTYTSVTTDAYGRVTAGTNPTTLSGYGITDASALGATFYIGSTPIANNQGTGTITLPNTALTNSSLTVGSTNIALGASSTTLAGLTSVTSTSFVGALTGNADTATNVDYTGLTGTVPTWNQNTTGNAATATTATTAGTVTTAAQPAITSVGTLTGLTVTNPIVGSLNGNADTATNVAYTGLTGTVPTWNQNTTGNAATATSATTAGTVTTAAQPAITSVGTLTGLTVTNPIVGSLNGNADTATTATTATTAGTVTTAAQPAITSVGTLTSLTTAGDVTVGGNLTINGTTTTVNSATLSVTDLNIVVGNAATSAAAANGAGLTVGSYASNPTLLYGNTNDNFTFNRRVDATSFYGSGAGLTSIPNSALTNSDVLLGSSTLTLGAATTTTLAGMTSITSTTFVGDLTGTASGNLVSGGALGTPSSGTLTNCTFPTLNQSTTGTAAVATTTTITNDVVTAITVFPTWVSGTTGNLATKTSSPKLRFVPTTGILSATGFAGALTGNVTGNVTGTAATVTGAAQTAITSVGTLSGLTVTAPIDGSVTGNAATVTTNANLTGPITSAGNATSIASQTGTGTTFAMSASPSFTGTVTSPAHTVTGGGITLDGGATDTPNIMFKDSVNNTYASMDVASELFRVFRSYRGAAPADDALRIDLSTGVVKVINTTAASSTTTGALTVGGGLGVAGSIYANQVTSTTGFTGALTGNVTGNVSGTAATVTTADQPTITSVGTLTGLTMGGTLTVPTGQVISIADLPTVGTSAANKNYVDNVVAGLTWKNAVNAATTANITLSGTQTIDGVAVVAGNRVLVKNQTTTSQNGIYVVAAGAWTRSTDMDSSTPINEFNNAGVFVGAGTTQDSTAWTVTSTVATVGTSAVTWAQFSGASVVAAGTGLSLTGNTLSVNASQTGVTALGTVTTGTWSASFGAVSGANLTNITGANVTGTVPNASLVGSGAHTIGSTSIALGATTTTLAGLTSVTSTSFVGALTGNASTATTAGTVTTAAQPNITSVGTLTGLTVSGTATSFPSANSGLEIGSNASANTPYIDFHSSANAVDYDTRIISSGGGVTAGLGTLTFTAANVAATLFTGALSGNATTATTATTANATNTANNFQMNSLGVGTAGSGTAGEIRATNNVTAYYSDARLKTVSGNISNALDKVCALNGVVYKNNEIAAIYGYTTQEEQVGVLAQEVKAVLPQVVTAAPFDIGQNEDGTEFSKSGQDYMTVRYDKLVPLLIEAIKELKAEVDLLKGVK